MGGQDGRGGSIRTVWFLYCAFIAYGGLIPFHFAGSHDLVRQRLHSLPTNPFISPESNQRLSIPDVVQNVLLFLPFGALGMAAGSSRSTRRVNSRLKHLLLVGVAGTTLSLLIESLQLFTADRVASVADVMTDTVGTLVGAIAAWVGAKSFTAWSERLRRDGLTDVPETRPFVVATIAAVVALWQPFDATLDVSTVIGKLKTLALDPWQFSGWRDEGTSIMLSVFFATTLASYLSVLGRRRVVFKSIVIGTFVVCSLEASQIVIASRMPSLWDALVGTTGIIIGAAMWAASARVLWPRLWLAAIMAATAGSAALQMLSPFDWAASYSSIRVFPFFGYYTHTTFEALSHVIELLLLYLPLGFFVGRAGGRRTLTASASLALTIAGPIEYLQGWIVGRNPDVTDIFISLCGASLGALVAQPSRNRSQ